MRRAKPYPVAQLTKGLDVSLDAMFLTDVASPNLDLVRFHKGIVKKDLGFTSFDGISERCMLIDTYYQVDGDEYMLLASVDHCYKYDESTSVWVKVSTDPGPAFTGAEDDMFWSTTMNDIFIITNGKDTMQKWDSTTWANLGGWSSRVAKYLQPFYNHLVGGYTVESGTTCPRRLRWSVIGDPEDDTGSGSGFADLNDTVDFITALALLSDRLFVFKERSIWEVLHIGGTDVFKPRLVIDGIGTYAGQSVISLGSELIFFGTDGIYLFDGANVEPVGEPVFPILYETGEKIIDSTKLNRSPAVYIEETGDYVVVLPTSTSLGEPELVIKYNLLDKSFSKRTKATTCFGLYSAQQYTTWAAATSAWNSGDWAIPWRQQQLPPGAPTTLYGQSDGTVELDNRVTKSTGLFTWESKDFMLGHASRWTEIRFRAKGDAFDVSYSTDQGRSWSSEVTLTPDSNDFTEVSLTDLNVTSQTLRIRARTYNEDIEIVWVEPWYIPRARSRELN